MINKTRYTLITAEILGFFLIIIGILGMVTKMPIFLTAFYILFFMVIVVAAIFASFMTLAVKQRNRKDNNLNKTTKKHKNAKGRLAQ